MIWTQMLKYIQWHFQHSSSGLMFEIKQEFDSFACYMQVHVDSSHCILIVFSKMSTTMSRLKQKQTLKTCKVPNKTHC